MAGTYTSKGASMQEASKGVCRMELASTREGRGRLGNTGTSHLPATLVTLRPPWGHMGARASTFGLAERCTRVVSKQVYLMDLQLWRSLAVGDMRASLWKGKCTVRAPSHGRMEPAITGNSAMGR